MKEGPLYDRVVTDFVWSENNRAQKCGCHECVTDATDRVDWYLEIGDYTPESTALVIRHKVIYTSKGNQDEDENNVDPLEPA